MIIPTTMTNQTIAVTVTILDREYQIACHPNEESTLRLSAEFLNSKMREIRVKGNVIGSDRIAVMAALNIAHEYLQLKPLETEYDAISQQLETLNHVVNKALTTTDDSH